MTAVLAALVWAAAAGAWAFILGYSVLARWWRTPVGRHMWSFGAMVALLLTLIIVTRALGRDYPGRDLVRIGCYGLLAFMVWHQVVLLLRLQLRTIRSRKGTRMTETTGDVITEVGTDAEAAAAAGTQKTLTAAILAETGTATVADAAEHATGTDEPDAADVDPDADSEPPVEAPDQDEAPLPDDTDEDVEAAE